MPTTECDSWDMSIGPISDYDSWKLASPYDDDDEDDDDYEFEEDYHDNEEDGR